MGLNGVGPEKAVVGDLGIFGRWFGRRVLRLLSCLLNALRKEERNAGFITLVPSAKFWNSKATLIVREIGAVSNVKLSAWKGAPKSGN